MENKTIIETFDEFLFNKYGNDNLNNPFNENYKPKTLSIEEPENEFDFEAITLGIGILNMQMNENNNEYDFLYNCLSEEWIYKCSAITRHYLKEHILDEDDVNYCIECLHGYLTETGLFNEPEYIGQPKNKRDDAHNKNVARIQQKRMDLIDAARNRRQNKNKLIAQKRKTTIQNNKAEINRRNSRTPPYQTTI